MKFFLDSASLDEIRAAKDMGLLDGVTTNPTLMSKEKSDWHKVAEAICREVDGPVSLEVVGTTAEQMLAEAKELVKYGPNVVVKIPMLLEGLKAVRALREQDIDVNVTLVFQPLQALMAAKAGATFVSPFVGRVDAIGGDGMAMVEEILAIFRNYDLRTQVLVASVRNPLHVVRAAIMGADVVTVPFAVLKDFVKHPLTDSGLESFLKDWEKVPKS
ncbi:Transaldolase [Fundidesulfovibrio magnetotacticus]|uniref:Probable transaldolase n=1 Tax=Fundidesulfovibrio magnetotacticus TaxID=2730080 RepID=A0A6V8LZV2_9BACT|nr:fructose-6-phosphate aldolase [Fundidesulfovibrio magnetotacticus]GFK95549.1 Transaldolase [Fundidesulfovibrio magnetotacticus]